MTELRDAEVHQVASPYPTGNGDGRPSIPSAPARAPMRPRRRPAWVALGIAVAAAGGVSTASLVASAGGHVSVLAVARDVPIGSVISADDLIAVRIGRDANLTPIPAREESSIGGQTAAVDLRRGSLLTPGEITSAAIPGAGQQLVGVALKPGQLPARPLAAGLRVLVVATPGDFAGSSSASGDPASLASVPTIPAVVVDVGEPGADGTVVVDLSVAATQGAQVAAIASTGHVALIEQPVGR